MSKIEWGGGGNYEKVPKEISISFLCTCAVEFVNIIIE